MPTPTPEQAAIIATLRDRPTVSLMVDARAGSAKTTTIEMASHVMEVPSASFVAFNKRIATELETRIPPQFSAMTLNGMGHRAWMRVVSGKKVNVDTDKVFKACKAIIPNDAMQADEDLMVQVLTLVRKAKSRGLVPIGAPFNRVGLVSDIDRSWDDIAFETGLSLSDEAIYYARLVLLDGIKQSYQGSIDFDDQIYMSVLFGGVFNRPHTLVVDEAQDLSPLNHEQLVKSFGVRLVAVGDPYQAIYGFRGADNNSMTTLMDRFAFERLGLTYSFRCPKLVTKRQLEHVPDFKSWETCPQGTVERWPKAADLDCNHGWSIADLPRSGFILCRNNAPLMKLAFAIIKTKRPVKILGRDIGATLGNLLDRIVNKQDVPVADAMPLLNAWKDVEMAKAVDSESKLATIYDRWECLQVLLEASGATTSKGAVNFIKDLFSDEKRNDMLTLSSGHKAKGLEEHWVMHLDPWRCPSKQARAAAERGDPGPLIQELNLKYVIETRTKAVLVEANLDDCEEMGE